MTMATEMTTNTSTNGNGGSASTGMARRDPRQAEKIQAKRTYAPPVDIYENADELLIVADMPGVNPDGVSVNIEKQELTIEGKRALREGEGNLLAEESESLDYRRSFVLPQGLDVDKISAHLSQGVLRVQLPKSPSVKPRQIQVKAG
jgi:HSP20 family protein